MGAKKEEHAEYLRVTPYVEMASGLAKKVVMTATRTTGTDARGHARWSAAMPARVRHPTHVRRSAGTASEQATRHAMTAIRSILTDAAPGARRTWVGLVTMRSVRDLNVTRYAATASGRQGRNATTATRTTGTDARGHARWSADMPAQAEGQLRRIRVLHPVGMDTQQARKDATTAT